MKSREDDQSSMSKLLLVVTHPTHSLMTYRNQIGCGHDMGISKFSIPSSSWFHLATQHWSPASRLGCALSKVTAYCISVTAYCITAFLFLFVLFGAMYCSRRLHFTGNFLLKLRGEVDYDHLSGPRNCPICWVKAMDTQHCNGMVLPQPVTWPLVRMSWTEDSLTQLSPPLSQSWPVCWTTCSSAWTWIWPALSGSAFSSV